jgi:apolipoprotein N-acyltransferase
MLGTSQYGFTSLIQLASITGIWGISFLVYGSNAVISYILVYGRSQTKSNSRRRGTLSLVGLLATAILVISLAGKLYLYFQSRDLPAETSTVALIQQNTDPRKDDYQKGLDILMDLTNQSLTYDPDLVVWSETAFVPNIRRWSQVDPKRNTYARLVRDLLDYQKSLSRWLVTGNDDYFISTNEEGEEIRDDYNASILFSPSGERVRTYHKIHLVPVTEYFPFKEQLPRIYELLLDWDVNLWTPGTDYVVFEHPDFTFSTPICFEDSFPSDVRKFVKAGAEVIINISNDFWSLTKVEAKQHFVNALFRSVENRRHLLRASASGVTAHITADGTIVSTLPYYEEGFLVAYIPKEPPRNSFYTFAGDWFPYVCFAIVFFSFLYQVFTVGELHRFRRTKHSDIQKKE